MVRESILQISVLVSINLTPFFFLPAVMKNCGSGPRVGGAIWTLLFMHLIFKE